MVICEICKKEFKNQGGLNLHKRSHKKSYTIKEVNGRWNITLYDGVKEVLTYPVYGNDSLDLAKKNALLRGYKIDIKSI